MTEGELIQLTAIGRLDVSEVEYFDILRRKTAYLFSACCEIGVILAGSDGTQQKAMRDFGMELGTAFQIADDLLDLTAEDDQLGKAAGSDLMEGKLTLPIILLLGREPALRPKIERIMLSGGYAEFSRDDLEQKLASYGILAEIRSQAQLYASHARKSIDVLPETKYRSSLEDILGFVIERET